ncbi:MAG: hypothetical protein IJT30_11295 [Muribaculaceae bacterium]|nr:hypothetical protein [Muribaculaceae bacterium]
MAKINISLVGKQTYPVFAQLIDGQPERVVLVCSAQTKGEADRVRRALGSKCPTMAVATQQLGTTNHSAVLADIRAMADVHCKPGNEVTVNLVGGTKLWSLWFHQAFAHRARCVIIDQNNKVLDVDTLESHRFDSSVITLDDIMGLAGVRISRKTPLSHYTPADIALISQIEEMRRINQRAFLDLTLDPPGGLPTLSRSRGCLLHYDKSACTVTAQMANQRQTFTKQFTLRAPHVAELLVNHGWFELKVGRLLAGWKQARQVWLGLEVMPAQGGPTLNEFDVIIETTGSKWVFVECKTQVYSSPDIDKFSEVSRRYGGMGSKVIFITDVPMKALAAEKCRQARIPHYDMQAISRNAAATTAFYNQLDSYTSEINA